MRWQQAYLVTPSVVNVREGPSMNASPLRLARTGPILAAGTQDGWRNIAVWQGGISGRWVSGWVAPSIRVETKGLIDLRNYILPGVATPAGFGSHTLTTKEVIHTDPVTGIIRKNEHIWQLPAHGPYFWFGVDTSPGQERYFFQSYEGEVGAPWIPIWWLVGGEFSFLRTPEVTFGKLANPLEREKPYQPANDYATLLSVERPYEFKPRGGALEGIEVSGLARIAWHNGDASKASEGYAFAEGLGFVEFFTTKHLGHQTMDVTLKRLGGELKPVGNWPGLPMITPRPEPEPPAPWSPAPAEPPQVEAPPAPVEPPQTEEPPQIEQPDDPPAMPIISDSNLMLLIENMLLSNIQVQRQQIAHQETVVNFVRYLRERTEEQKAPA